MQKYYVKKGVNLPIEGNPIDFSEKSDVANCENFAILAEDYINLKAGLLVKEGDIVEAGTPLFKDKNIPGVLHVSPVHAKVESIERHEKRAFFAVKLKKISDKVLQQKKYSMQEIDGETVDNVQQILLNTGFWSSFTKRPFGTVADPATRPSAIFVTAVETRPLSAPVKQVMQGNEEFFAAGLKIVSKFTQGKVFLCIGDDDSVKPINEGNIETAIFGGIHPAGLAGTHVHFLHGVSRKRFVWEIGYQDVIRIGKLFLTGVADYSTVLSIAGEGVTKPYLKRATIGSNIYEITKGKLASGNYRIISGNPLYGRMITEDCPWLGRYNQQISVIPEGRDSTLLSWMTWGPDLFSIKRIFTSHIIKPKQYHFDTSMRGSLRSMVPVGSYEQVMPLDISATTFLKSIVVCDTEMAEKLGALELLEEDLSLCTYVSPGKSDFAPYLRNVLNIISTEI